MNLDLSVIIACYNCQDTIEKCLDSIPKNIGIEIILINDKSTDSTSEVIDKYITNHSNENIIKVNNNKNLGAGLTRNVGISKATRQYITFLDSDDELSTDFLSIILSRIVENYDCIIFDALHITNSSAYQLKMFYTLDLHEGEINTKDALVFVKGATWGKIYKREIVINNNVIFGSINRNEDLIFTKTAIANCKHVFYIEKPLYNYIENENSLMHNKNLLTEKNAFIAVNTIKDTLVDKGFLDEFNSIYFLEIVYSTTLIFVLTGKSYFDCKNHFAKVLSNYDLKDKYRKRYYKKYRLAFLLFRLRMFGIFKIIKRK